MRRTLVALTLAASVLTAAPSGFFEPLWRFLSSFWTAPSAKSGCGLDPDGQCKTAPQLQSDSGCGMDPLGCPKGGS